MGVAFPLAPHRMTTISRVISSRDSKQVLGLMFAFIDLLVNGKCYPDRSARGTSVRSSLRYSTNRTLAMPIADEPHVVDDWRRKMSAGK